VLPHLPIAILAGALVFAPGANGTSEAFPGANGAIVFTSSKNTGAAPTVWVAKGNGMSARRLVAGPGRRPAWAPDGHRLAYTWNGAIYAVRADGTARQRIGYGEDPAWSPDGKRLVATAYPEVFLIDLTNGQAAELPELTDHGIGYFEFVQPAWSPDAKQIAFMADAGGGPEIALYVLEKRRIRQLGLRGAHPSWSPDGKRLAFDTDLAFGKLSKRNAVYVGRTDGTHVRLLASNAAQPVWSPDGRRILFVRLATRSNSELFVMNVDGTHQRRLTFRPGLDRDPDWQRASR
jgi:TolB protein